MAGRPPVARRRSLRVVGWILALGYGIGAPLCAVLELHGHVFSRRFHLPPALMLGVCVVQFACAMTVNLPRLAPWAAAVLTLTTLGAVGAHLRIGSPRTAISAVVFTAIQVWYIVVSVRSAAGEPKETSP